MMVFDSIKIHENRVNSHYEKTLLETISHLEQENKTLLQKITQLESRLNHDYLTKLKSREAALNAIDSSLNNNKVHTIAIVFMDMDNLKLINDYGGHILGDEALKLFGSTLKLLEKPAHCISRLGGDEFIAILPNYTESQVREWCFALDETLQKIKPLIFNTQEIKVTVSTGYYLYDKLSDNLPKTSQDMIELADFSMYESKREKFTIRKRPPTTQMIQHIPVQLENASVKK
ncbi:GGDEF domain-containing protein [Vibrio sp. Vb1018]|uniref:GGDEF domain-containing protein n=1 Tax=Vibrio sp. Vb1018 TaxID=3074636 RepID=UPI0029653592|nr:GGDEF domain-containing protein [Vibrio sp. Vb1018]MDW1820188.1 GGDEF domain-containing protein [Vibrio sp. Vb1018]